MQGRQFEGSLAKQVCARKPLAKHVCEVANLMVSWFIGFRG